MHSYAVLFPGQGSQSEEMGRQAYECYSEARTLFDAADAQLGYSLSSLCFHGSTDELHDTVVTQPAVFVTSLALWGVIESRSRIQVSHFAGHSLGQLTATVASGSLDFGSGLQLVRERGALMKMAGQESPGGMVAILGSETETVSDICHQVREDTGQVLQIANHNAPGQIVISGDEDALLRASELALSLGAKKAVRLPVSIAAHSPKMAIAAERFREVVGAAQFRDPAVPIVDNVTARPLMKGEDIADSLVQQLTHPVHWVTSIQAMTGAGVKSFLEVGPGNVLTSLLKRIDRGVSRASISGVEDIESLIGGD
jgi:[acyl-carrier-protein] S-malonyltransferase